METYLKKKSIPIPLYGGDLIIIFSNSVEKIQKEVPHFKKKHLFAYSSYDDSKGRDYFIILNFDDEFEEITPGIIAHEALHVGHYIFHDIGADSDLNNDEPLAYLLKWIVDQVHEFHNETTDKK